MVNSRLNLLKKQKNLVAIDIGASGVRVLESDFLGDEIEILNFAYKSFDEEIYQNQLLAKQDVVSNTLIKIFEENKISSNDIVTAIPGPAAFSKKISVTKMDNLEDLDSNIKFESNSLIPHGLDGVYFDYAILQSSNDSNNVDVFITAVKKDIVNSIQNTLTQANLNLKILDIDYLALLNLFEFNYPEFKDKTVALIDIGGRYSTINVCYNGEMLFSTNIPIGGRLIAEDLSNSFKTTISESDLCNLENIQIETTQNESVKENIVSINDSELNNDSSVLLDNSSKSADLLNNTKIDSVQTVSTSLNNSSLTSVPLQESLDKQIEKIANDLKKQLKYYWESGSLDSIEKIFITGGGVYWKNINKIFSQKFNIECETLDPLRKVKIRDIPQKSDIIKRNQQLAVLLGLSLRRIGDSKKRYIRK